MAGRLLTVSEDIEAQAVAIGKKVRAQRKALRVTATAAAEAAGISRVTWFRIEKGVPTVSLGAYLSALAVLNITIKTEAAVTNVSNNTWSKSETEFIPVQVALGDYPQLKQLAWQVHGVEALSPREALDIYERNRRHLDFERMDQHERCLIEALRRVFRRDDPDV